MLAGGVAHLQKIDLLKLLHHIGHTYQRCLTMKRSMAFWNAGILTDDETYAITAYILYSSDLIDDDFYCRTKLSLMLRCQMQMDL